VLKEGVVGLAVGLALGCGVQASRSTRSSHAVPASTSTASASGAPVQSTGSDHATSTESPLRPELIEAIALRWFNALRRKDAEALAALTSVPSSIRGFSLDSGPDAEACGAAPRADGLTGVRAFDAGSGIQREISAQSDIPDVFRCLFLDAMLVDSIPVPRDGRWPPDRGDSKDGVVGSLHVVGTDEVAEAFNPYRGQLVARSGSDVLVQARMVDNNGLTNHVLLALSKSPPHLVNAVYIHELFEC
jgi:hypothetical protein